MSVASLMWPVISLHKPQTANCELQPVFLKRYEDGLGPFDMLGKGTELLSDP